MSRPKNTIAFAPDFGVRGGRDDPKSPIRAARYATLEKRLSKGASKELLAQLSADALKEQEEERLKAPARRTNLAAVVIDFNRARRGATE